MRVCSAKIVFISTHSVYDFTEKHFIFTIALSIFTKIKFRLAIYR